MLDESHSKNITQNEFPEIWCYGCGTGMHEKNSIKCQCGAIVCKNCRIIRDYIFMCKLCVSATKKSSGKKCDICSGDFFSYNCHHTNSCDCTTYISCRKCERTVCLKCGKLSGDLCDVCVNNYNTHICDRCNRLFETKVDIIEKIECDSCSKMICPICRTQSGKNVLCYSCIKKETNGKCNCYRKGDTVDICVVCNDCICVDCKTSSKCSKCTRECKVTCTKINCMTYMTNVCCMKNCDDCKKIFCSTCYRNGKCFACAVNTDDKKCTDCREKITVSEICVGCDEEFCLICIRWTRCKCNTKVWVCEKCCQHCGEVCTKCAKEKSIICCHYNAEKGTVVARIHFVCVMCDKKFCNGCTSLQNVCCLGCKKKINICGNHDEEIFCSKICSEETEKCRYCDRASCRPMHYCQDSPGCGTDSE